MKLLILSFILIGCASPKKNYRYPDYSYVCTEEEKEKSDCIIYDNNVQRTSDHYFKEWERMHSQQRPE